jgi:hypothetical protein
VYSVYLRDTLLLHILLLSPWNRDFEKETDSRLTEKFKGIRRIVTLPRNHFCGPYLNPGKFSPHCHTLFFKIHFNIMLTSKPFSAEWTLLFRCSTKLYVFLISHIHAACSANLNLDHFYTEHGDIMFPESLVPASQTTRCRNPEDHNINL